MNTLPIHTVLSLSSYTTNIPFLMRRTVVRERVATSFQKMKKLHVREKVSSLEIRKMGPINQKISYID